MHSFRSAFTHQAPAELAGAVDAARLEMAPAAVIGNPEIGIAAARDVGDRASRRKHAIAIDPEVSRSARSTARVMFPQRSRIARVDSSSPAGVGATASITASGP